MPCTHVGGTAGKKGTEAMQHRINVLRKNITRLENVVVERNDRIRQLRADNAKLRELCAGLWSVMWACAEQRCPHRYEDCFVVSGNGGGPKGHGECWYKQRMRELGIKV